MQRVLHRTELCGMALGSNLPLNADLNQPPHDDEFRWANTINQNERVTFSIIIRSMVS